MVMAISLTSALKGSNPRILKDTNHTILRINEPICDFDENPISSKSETPTFIFEFISSSYLPHSIP